MDRITSIISAISIFISCIAGYRTENTEFDDLEALAISAALSYHTQAWNGSIDTDTPDSHGTRRAGMRHTRRILNYQTTLCCPGIS